MRHIAISAALLLITLTGFSASKTGSATITVFPTDTVGPLKLMNAANNGPVASNFEDYKALRIPYARTHDTALGTAYGQHCIDISIIFPDWSKSPSNPDAYDFTITDQLIARMVESGTQPFYRLGQSIEHQIKKYGIYPPKNFLKWAKICEHVILHYNEGWADGFHYGIKYWEIWNEADLDSSGRWKTDPRTWGGPIEQFYAFYGAAAKYLKSKFPGLKIGGPAFAGPKDQTAAFLDFVRENEIPLDFYSWHTYAKTPETIAKQAGIVRGLLDEKGFGNVESILDEWNYVRAWQGEQVTYGVRVRAGLKGAAFVTATMCKCQNEPVDMLMYYDLRPNTSWNGAFAPYTYDLQPTYYSFLWWAELAVDGVQVRTSCDAADIYTCAAAHPDGTVSLLVSRFNEDESVTDGTRVEIALPKGYRLESFKTPTGNVRLSKETVTLEPNAIALLTITK